MMMMMLVLRQMQMVDFNATRMCLAACLWHSFNDLSSKAL